MQHLAVEKIVLQNPDVRHICINLTDRRVEWEGIEEVLTFERGSKVSMALQYWKIFKRIRDLRRENSVFNVFIPHPYHSIPNFLAFYTKPTTINLLPDGILNYYNCQITRSQLWQMIKKKFTLFLGGNYRIYKGSIIASDYLNYTANYVFLKRGVVTDVGVTKVLELAEQNRFPNSTERKILFIDQPLEFFSKDAQEAIKKKIKDFFQEKNVELVLYKPHREQKRKNLQLKNNQKTISIRGMIPVELISQEFEYNEIVGICSSALITLRLMNQNLPIYSIGINKLRSEKPELLDIQKLLEDLNIKIIDA